MPSVKILLAIVSYHVLELLDLTLWRLYPYFLLFLEKEKDEEVERGVTFYCFNKRILMSASVKISVLN